MDYFPISLRVYWFIMLAFSVIKFILVTAVKVVTEHEIKICTCIVSVCTLSLLTAQFLCCIIIINSSSLFRSVMLQNCWHKPKFHYANFHQNFSSGNVVDTNHESHGHKRWQILKSWSFGESCRHKSRKSQTQTTCRDVCDKVRDKSTTNPFVSL